MMVTKMKIVNTEIREWPSRENKQHSKLSTFIIVFIRKVISTFSPFYRILTASSETVHDGSTFIRGSLPNTFRRIPLVIGESGKTTKGVANPVFLVR